MTFTNDGPGVWILISPPPDSGLQRWQMFINKHDSEVTVEDGWLAGHTITVEHIPYTLRETA